MLTPVQKLHSEESKEAASCHPTKKLHSVAALCFASGDDVLRRLAPSGISPRTAEAPSGHSPRRE